LRADAVDRELVPTVLVVVPRDDDHRAAVDDGGREVDPHRSQVRARPALEGPDAGDDLENRLRRLLRRRRRELRPCRRGGGEQSERRARAHEHEPPSGPPRPFDFALHAETFYVLPAASVAASPPRSEAGAARILLGLCDDRQGSPAAGYTCARKGLAGG